MKKTLFVLLALTSGFFAFSQNPANNKEAKKEYLQKSVQYGEQALFILPNHIITMLDLGLSYLDLKNFDKAATLWLAVLTINPKNADAKKGIFSLFLVIIIFCK